ncbi:hypothetical protein HN832_00500 [archaeon]|jgi:hypothetical protein|nr:hypothetical protein [archaeon]MBT4373722.1 hypothetical protein [archaeon]MBT4531776.1 hypothetical protein [archaeon]MBT7001888.1 hypothetical protein [archaeon]MBT7281873.1 hypothetical protein [archaeon]
MVKREKRLEKQIQGLKKQIEKHKEKLINEFGRKDTTHDYWKKEIKQFEEQVEEREKMLDKLRD